MKKINKKVLRNVLFIAIGFTTIIPITSCESNYNPFASNTSSTNKVTNSSQTSTNGKTSNTTNVTSNNTNVTTNTTNVTSNTTNVTTNTTKVTTNTSNVTDTTKVTTNTTNVTTNTTNVTTNATKYTVSFNSEGGTSVSTQTITSGGKASSPKNPTRANCVFDGWYTSYNYTTKYNFNNKVTTNTTLYAKWIIDVSNPLYCSSRSKIWSDGVSIYQTMKNVSGIDIYYFENVSMTVKNASTNYVCASGGFGNVKFTNYLKNGTTISDFDFFFSTEYCDLAYWKNNTFTFAVNMSYDAIVLPNELK